MSHVGLFNLLTERLTKIGDEEKEVAIVIEKYNGETEMAFTVSIDSEGNFDVTKTYNCCHADTDEDYVIRIQSEAEAFWQMLITDDNLATASCSECGWTGVFEESCFYKYCPECGTYMNTDCPNGGDIRDDCKDCAYSGDYHFCNGECVKRNEEK